MEIVYQELAAESDPALPNAANEWYRFTLANGDVIVGFYPDGEYL